MKVKKTHKLKQDHWKSEQNGTIRNPNKTGHFVKKWTPLENWTPLEIRTEGYHLISERVIPAPLQLYVIPSLFRRSKILFFSAKTPCDKCPELCMLSGKNLYFKQNKGSAWFIHHTSFQLLGTWVQIPEGEKLINDDTKWWLYACTCKIWISPVKRGLIWTS